MADPSAAGRGPGHTGGDVAVPSPRTGDSITDFLTDGSVVRLCAAINAMVSSRVILLDRLGRWVVPSRERDAPEPWTIEPAPPDIGPDAIRVPIRLEGRSIGEFVLIPNPEAPPTQIRHMREVADQLAALSSEFCHEAAAMRSRIRELEALFRLSALLAEEGDSMDRLLGVALRLALGVLDLDAGSIVLFPADADGVGAVPAVDSEADVVTTTSVNLSEGWLNNPLPLSAGRVFDRLVIEGHTLAIPDLMADPRVLAPERCADEGVRSFLSAALVHRDRPIGVVRVYGRDVRSFGVADQRLLRSIGEQAATAVAQARLLDTERRERAMERQLRLASDVQRRMMPHDLPAFPGLDAAARNVPTSELGGDLYDVFKLDGPGGSCLGLVVGDVVGKGVPAALLMSAVRASLRAHATSAGRLAETVGRTNRDLCRDTLPNEFTTLWFGSVDPATRTLTYCSAGHDPPLVIRATPERAPTRDDVVSLCIGGLVLGINPGEIYGAASINLGPGDVLVAYTDGVTDARNFQDEKWGWGRMADAALDVLTQHPGASASTVLDNILWSLRRFVGLRPQVDDETLVVLRVTPEG
ncbi:MAG: SpoIIE family protein phosphatase [Phycisphaeraceae bacterium]|nr:MAG: SpoIIE family protein phosphatase [Phycisphaeraceae bacterium]